MKLILGNRNYSSWSLRGWLAAKQSGLPFSEEVIPLYGEGWDERRRAMPELAPSGGKVPVLWDGEAVVWDSLAIIDYLADKVGRERFWPRSEAARALARSMAAEMHSSYMALRSRCPMNLRRRESDWPIGDDVRAEVVRILALWAEARARFGQGGPFLFGPFGAADIVYAPVVCRIVGYGIEVPGFARTYVDALWEHEWLREWIAAAEQETCRIEAFELARPAAG